MRSAFIRALRTGAQTLAGALIAFPTIDSVSKLPEIGNSLILAIYTAAMSALVALLHNLAEDAAGAPESLKG